MDFRVRMYSFLQFQFSGLYIFAQDARELFDDSNVDTAHEVVTESDAFSDCGTVLEEGEQIRDDADVEFLERAFRCTQSEADGVVGIIRGSIGPNRFTAFSSMRSGVVTAQWKDIWITSIYY